jgi:hypothetical protein
MVIVLVVLLMLYPCFVIAGRESRKEERWLSGEEEKQSASLPGKSPDDC